MKHTQIVAQEPYEAPAILDIAPISFTSVVGLTGDAMDPGEPSDDDLD